MTSVERLRGLTFETPTTYFPSHLRRNLKFLYGSTRVGFTVKPAIGAEGWRSFSLLVTLRSSRLFRRHGFDLRWIQEQRRNPTRISGSGSLPWARGRSAQ